MPFIKYTDSQLYGAQEICAEYSTGKTTLESAVKWLRALGIKDDKITRDLFDAFLVYVYDTARVSEKSSLRYRKMG